MKKLNEFLPLAELLVNEISEKINQEGIGLKEAEERVLEFVNRVGHLLVEKVIEKVSEPTVENRIKLGDMEAVYRGKQNLRFIDRFGKEMVISRRSYKLKGGGSYYPLDEKLSLDVCAGFSPLMTYLLTFLGGCEAYVPAARKLSKTIGFKISSTAVQNNSEATGRRVEHDPYKAIPASKHNEECKLMVVAVDGTMSPQIQEVEGLTGRESLRLPTQYKECNVIVVEKTNKDGSKEKWHGAHYGPRVEFDEYAHRVGIALGQLKAKEIVFIADGARHNWDLQLTNFPNATAILDFYHATEHLSDFCETVKNTEERKKAYNRWKGMLYEGETVQVICELKEALLSKVSNRDEAQKHINYFLNNKERMNYWLYRQKGYPLGSGIVEGACKYVVGYRFKGSGMRWKQGDNKAILDSRLSVLNDTLDEVFIPKPKFERIAA